MSEMMEFNQTLRTYILLPMTICQLMLTAKRKEITSSTIFDIVGDLGELKLCQLVCFGQSYIIDPCRCCRNLRQAKRSLETTHSRFNISARSKLWQWWRLASWWRWRRRRTWRIRLLWVFWWMRRKLAHGLRRRTLRWTFWQCR